ncbi:hypothetical protein HETIRDRAFT_144363 [Heterobasidion irregulare TC 32-1]|uniref:Signal peptidase complex subunit 2 n=1 Tax=Heterobasidion irregulare (strain TC 32-1) TaxID=747525 RepID=W4JWG8_HETIT|nr:uncharacterized protein HETIRDRAFT_144363 [Heterobasidion irregulare TC 32-1]ETW77892.1 hypothetical protein HETIRDRAFT_144363 [Heterobasidion irregulare TC 32-1]
MARGRKILNGDSADKPITSTEPSETKPSPPRASLPALAISAAAQDVDRDEVKVNSANLSELKNACDDALKRFLSRPDLFKQIHLHTDVRLALGWAGVFVAAGTAFYGWKVDFEQSKPVMWVGLVLYVLLTLLQTLYAYFIEGDIVFVGKRKTFDKRIVTERITLSARTLPSTPEKAPHYSLSVAYLRSSGAGKSLLAKGHADAARGYDAFFDAAGVLDQVRFEAWLSELVGRVMEAGAE